MKPVIYPIRHASIFLTLLFLFIGITASSQTFDYGKSYVNISKGTTGGTVEPGDILQIRTTFVVKSGSFDSCGYTDMIPAGTSYIPGSLCIITNEGKVYKSFTDAASDDCGQIIGSNIKINLGFNPTNKPATPFRRGTIRNTDRPSFFGSACIMVAAFNIRVNAGYGSTINLGSGTITYKNGIAPINIFTYPANVVSIFKNFGICSNTIGGNSIGAEFNGTFGSGKARNRGVSGSVPPNYAFQYFTTGGPQDYYYGIANNTSTLTNYTTSNNWAKPDNSTPSHRVFGVWDIIGDHTGAVNPFLGNPASDTVTKNNGGYMLVINAAYRTDSAFKHTISGLCPNTYYEVSAWIRNICSRCSSDSAGRGASSAGYIPSAPGDSSGVNPNLTFEINGIDYYSTGNIQYSGQWVKKGFTYLTGPGQTSLTLTILNNAPGGGGNDWAIDDISVATCSPDLNMIPYGNANVCYGNQVDISCDVIGFFDNYTHWLWEKSTDGGATWTSTGVSGVSTPILVAGQYQYNAAYPSFLGDSASHLNILRIRVASSAANLLNPNCSFIASSQVVVFVKNCSVVLKTTIEHFSGTLKNEHSYLQWTSANETNATQFIIEKSTDKIHFSEIGIVKGIAGEGNGAHYNFTDPAILTADGWYRILIKEAANEVYSKTILISPATSQLKVSLLENPFLHQLPVLLNAPGNGMATIMITNHYGHILKKQNLSLKKGNNSITLTGLGILNAGIYTLNVISDKEIINKRIIKLK